jgi:hypothetical protein
MDEHDCLHLRNQRGKDDKDEEFSTAVDVACGMDRWSV